MNIDQVAFEENIKIFSQKNPKVSIYLEGSDALIDPPKENSEEVTKWFLSQDLKNANILYLIGLKQGAIYEASKKWLQEDSKRKIIFLEPDLRLIISILKTKMGQDLLKDQQVEFYALPQSVSEQDELLGWLSWASVQEKIQVLVQPCYEADFSLFVDKILFECAQKNDIVDEYLKFGIVFYRNFYRNVWMIPKSLKAAALFGKFHGVPAIICGAGPSLKNNLHVLSTLTDKALIFAGGSSLNALRAGGVTPHFGAGVDPNPTQYYRLLGTSSVSVPFFYRLRMQYQALREVQGPLLYLNGAGGYDTADWLEKELGIEGEAVDEGHNVVNMCAEVARAMGCNPLIFVGMDLAYTDLKHYAEGVVEDPSMDEKALNLSAVTRKDIHGEPVYTEWKWVAESEWLSKYKEEHLDLTILNATEGGLGFRDIPNVSLEEVVNTYLTKDFILTEWIQDELKGASLEFVSPEHIESALLRLREGLVGSLKEIETLLEETEMVREMVVDGEEPPDNFQSGLAALAETELVENEAYMAVLDIFNTMYAHILNNELQIAGDDKLKKLDLMIKKYQFLKNVIQANLILLDEGNSEQGPD